MILILINLNIYDRTDPYIGYAVDNKYQPQIGVGIFYNTQNYYLGFLHQIF